MYGFPSNMSPDMLLEVVRQRQLEIREEFARARLTAGIRAGMLSGLRAAWSRAIGDAAWLLSRARNMA
ncbi:MAG TPA: hypothetical protein VOB72_12815 [Candidatus Dormibacteraeota bacterium]|nr:hypothetical protein [Candidatus Dormibacteraeota bacterium]